MKVRSLIQEFMDDFLGLYISPKNRLMNSLLIGPGLPGGMMGSLMSDLEKNLETINKNNIKNNKPLMSQDQLLIKLFDEVAYVWPRVGYPPLVTPFSQYVKNVALLNIVQMAKGEERYSMMDENTWSMILGKAGKLPGPLAPEIIELAKEKGKEFYTGTPQDLYPDALEKYQRTFLRRCGKVVNAMLTVYPYLENYVDARNHTARIWLHWLGFTIDEPQPYGINNLPFHRFHMERK